MYRSFVGFVQELYSTKDYIPLHVPCLVGREKEYLLDVIDSTFVSSVGAYVDQFEAMVVGYTGVKYAIATVNGTAALHIALKLSGVSQSTEVITQSLTFVATCNAIHYCGAEPVFVDVDRSTLGLSPKAVSAFLEEHAEIRNDGFCWNKSTNRKISACLPMHTFGFPVQLDKIKQICEHYNIALVEDAAESLGSYYKGKHTGQIGILSAISFNGNKVITTGGGGMILTSDETLAKRAKHLTTTAKIPHKWSFSHDEIAFNYRLPNINAALGVAQMELLPDFIKRKREIAQCYKEWGAKCGMEFVVENVDSKANYWLNTAIFADKQQRDEMLNYTNTNGVMTRPAWTPMHQLSMFQHCQRGVLTNTQWLLDRIVNVPSSVNI